MEFFQRNEQALASEQSKLDKQALEWGNNAPMLYLRPGTTVVRVLPPYSSAGVFFKKVVKHRVRVGTDTSVFLCPGSMEGSLETCPVCEKGQELTESRDEIKMKFARENLRPRATYLYNVMCMTAPIDPKKGEVPASGSVLVMEGGVMVHRQIISLDQDPATGWADITNPEAGVTLVIKRTGQGLDTKYEVNPHGGGRTHLFAEATRLGVNPTDLKLFNLDEVSTPLPADKMADIVSSLRTVGAFSSPTFAPVAIPVVAPIATTIMPTVAATPVAAPAINIQVPVSPINLAPLTTGLGTVGVANPAAVTPAVAAQVLAAPVTIPVIPPPPGQQG